MTMSTQLPLSGKVIVITGATSGVGKSLAVACANAGATIAAIGRSSQKLEALKEIISDRHYFKSFDVTDYANIKPLIADIVDKCGKISGFVHSAGIVTINPINSMTSSDYEKIFATNVIAGFEFVKHIVAKKNIAENSSILLISSVSALKGEVGLVAYSASKGAILSGMRSLAAELARKKIRVNALIPGQMIDTEMGQNTVDTLPPDALEVLKTKHPLGFGNTSSLTGAAIYFLSDESWWVTGSSLQIDGGFCL